MHYQQQTNNRPMMSANGSFHENCNTIIPAHISMVVKEIQMAVSEGYLDSKILNEPMTPSSLLLMKKILELVRVIRDFMCSFFLAILFFFFIF